MYECMYVCMYVCMEVCSYVSCIDVFKHVGSLAEIETEDVRLPLLKALSFDGEIHFPVIRVQSITGLQYNSCVIRVPFGAGYGKSIRASGILQ